MRKCVISISLAGALSTVGAAGLAQTQDEGEIEVQAQISPFIELTIVDSTLDWSAPNFSDAANVLFDNTTPGEGRARFSVEANTDYSLTVTTADGCWQASNLLPSPEASVRQVRFIHEANGDWIGGELFLDRFPDSPGFSHAWNNNGGDCRITTGSQIAETHVWGLGANFRPRLVGNESNPGGVVGQLPVPGTYSATARITAATQ